MESELWNFPHHIQWKIYYVPQAESMMLKFGPWKIQQITKVSFTVPTENEYFLFTFYKFQD